MIKCIFTLGLLIGIATQALAADEVGASVIEKSQTKDTISYQVFTADMPDKDLDAIAQIVITEFKKPPYAYNGTAEEYKVYYKKFFESPHSVIVVAYNNDKPVGFAAGAALSFIADSSLGCYDPTFKKYFESPTTTPESLYLLSECIVVPEKQEQKIALTMFYMLTEKAKMLGFKGFACITEGQNNSTYEEVAAKVHAILVSKGFLRMPNQCSLSWETFQADGTVKEQEHFLDCWALLF